MKRFLFLLGFFSLNLFGDTGYLEVGEITVKTSDRNSLSAKQKALEISAKKAFDKLIDINFPEADRLKGKLSHSQIRNCVYDYSIEQEKFSGKTYIAEFSFRFSEDTVLKTLRSQGILEPEKKVKKLRVAIYREDYLRNPEIFKNVSVHLFSKKKIILNISPEFKDVLKESKIKFAEINS